MSGPASSSEATAKSGSKTPAKTPPKNAAKAKPAPAESAPPAFARPSAGPRITIVTVSLNQGQYLEETLRSVREQTYPHIEHVVVDGGSTDGSLRLLREHEEQCPFPLQWCSEPDRGQSHAYNKAFAMAGGDWLLYLNSGDYLHAPDSLATAVELMGEDPGFRVYAFPYWFKRKDRAELDPNSRWSDADPALPGELVIEGGAYAKWRWCLRYPLPHEGTLFHREIVSRVGGYSEKFRSVTDLDFFCQVLLRTSIRLMPAHRLTVFLLHEDNAGASHTQRSLWDRFLARHRAGAPLWHPDQLFRLLSLVFPGPLRPLTRHTRPLERRLRLWLRAQLPQSDGRPH